MNSCPSSEKLKILMSDQPEGLEFEGLEAHVEGCPACQEVLEKLAIASEFRKVPATDSSIRKFLARLAKEISAPTQKGDSTTIFQTPTVPDRTHPPVVQGYEILEMLGRGGMGVVFKARQVALNRLVALKMIREGNLAGTEEVARFRREAEAVAQLQHPNIVQIFEVGKQAEGPFMALELVDAGNLAGKLRRGLPPVRQAAHLIETLARAIHVAHEHGIVHRDLKPGNILLTADSQPKISDFGLAKHVAASKILPHDDSLTRSGDILGTPDYMAPEQAAGRTREAGPASDIFSLGAILYEMLTGRPPFSGRSTLDTIQRILKAEPTPPCRLQPHVPRDLQTICLTCLHKDPTRRYASALGLAEDLHAFLAGEPIQARPAGYGQRLWQGFQHRPFLAAFSGLTCVIMIGLLVESWSHVALAVGAVAATSLLLASWWFNSRLQSALVEADHQHLQAQRNVERIHLLLETTRRLLRTRDLGELLQILSETTTTMTNAERATIYLVDQDRGELWSKVALGDGVGQIRIPLGQGIAGTVALTGETIKLADPYKDPRFHPEVDRRTGYRTRNLLTLPMKDQTGRILGVFQVINKRGGTFDAEDSEILYALAASAALAVEKSQG